MMLRALALVAGLALGLAWLSRSDDTPPLVGEAIPPLQLSTAGGGEWALQDYQGRVLVLNLWATWCPPCRAELPSLQRLQDSLPPDRFAVVGLSIDEDAFMVEEMLRRLEIRFDVVVDPSGKRSAPALRTRALPETFLIRADGVIAERILGEQDWDSPASRARILALDDGGA